VKRFFEELMMGQERRRHERYETDLDIQFSVTFDVKTKIDFRVKKKKASPSFSEKYSAVSRNVSVEGLSFTSEKELQSGDMLSLDVYVPSASRPIKMEGQVRWCQVSEEEWQRKKLYDTGVRILAVEGETVEKTIFTDSIHSIVWSIVLESVFGTFKHLILERKKIPSP
jgi:hypothetical protein